MHRTNKLAGIPAFLVVFAAAVLALGQAAVASEPSLAQQVQTARTPADHEALAKRYEEEAAQARSRAQDHRLLSKSYQSGTQYPQSPWTDRVGPAGSTATGMPPMPAHCEKQAQAFDEIAKTYLDMAALHRRLAKQAPK